MPAAIHSMAVLSLFLFLAGCGAGDLGAVAGGDPVEQARLQLVDKCMFDRSGSADPMDRSRGPRCQCYAREVTRQMTPAQASAYLSSGAVPMSVRIPDIQKSCARG